MDLLSRLDMMLLGNYFKVGARLASYSEWNSSVSSNRAENPSHHHISFPILVPMLSLFLAQGTFLVPSPFSQLLYGKVFPCGCMFYSCSVSVSSWKSFLLDCVTFSYDKLSYDHILHSISFIVMSWLSFYPTILRASCWPRRGWVLFLQCLGTCLVVFNNYL